MKTEYKNLENTYREYIGVSFNDIDTRSMLTGKVKNLLLDTPQRKVMIEYLQSLQNETGFKCSETLLTDIQALENQNVDMQDFRIGEAIAEVVLGEHFSCRFYWNELRDARNPKGNKTGADLVGFIEIDNQVLFLFGEVKTSSEKTAPPQVMTNPTGIEKQLKELYKDRKKRLFFISYIKNKLQLQNNGSNFQTDFDKAIRYYYKSDSEANYLLYGVLVRDTQPKENDLKPSYDKLKNEVLTQAGLKLLAIYLPISKNEWLNIINGAKNEN
ncbi:MAG: hypothetical protein ACUVQP_04665 [Bacteroidales bacterium]